MRGTAFSPPLAGNTIEGLEAAHRQRIRYVEIDLLLTRDRRLVTAHEPPLAPCGVVSRLTEAQIRGCRLEGGLHVATLEQALEIPFAGVFLDLKDTKQTDEHARHAVAEAVRVVGRQRRRNDVVLMVYRADPVLIGPIQRAGLRGGLKGYPESVEETRGLVDRAAEHGLEMLCVNAERVTRELIHYSAKKGVWHLPWSIRASQADAWAELARAGVGGLIVLHYDLAKRRAAPHWQPLPR